MYNSDSWVPETEAFCHCVNTEVESTIYLDVKGAAWEFSGFFVETGDRPTAQVYSMVANSKRRYLYKVHSNWILSGEIGSTLADAYVEDAAANTPSEITSSLWHFGNGTGWNLYEVFVISGNSDATVMRNLHLHRKITALPPNQNFFELANGVIMPSVGM